MVDVALQDGAMVTAEATARARVLDRLRLGDAAFHHLTRAAANADWSSVPGFGVILANQPGAGSWPMTAATFILIPREPADPAATAEALKFFAWAYAKGDKMADELDYVPMPKKVIEQVEKAWASEIKDSSGKPLYIASAMAH